MQFELTDLALPEFGLPSEQPTIPASRYLERLASLKDVAIAAGYTHFIVYGDREHFANLTFLTGFDPRFEEALLVINLASDSKPLLMVGNEGWGFAHISPIVDAFELVLYQPFGLLGQDRSKSLPLAEIFSNAGITAGAKVGCAGWKHYTALESPSPKTWLEIPAYLVDTLRELVGDRDVVENANHLLMGASDGLRVINDVDQLAVFEHAATYSSQALKNVLFGVKPGMSELEAFQLMQLPGLPLNCHAMLSSGERAFLGMDSPSGRMIQHGDPFTNAVGIWGSLNARAGFMVSSAAELPAEIGDYLEKLVIPYFHAVVEWYEKIGIGVPGGDLYQIIHNRIGDPFFGVHLNPGHQVHLDEWVNSPIYAGSTETIESGMAFQVDVIPATGTPYFTTNIEDGIAIADEGLRNAFAASYPGAWARIEARRAFMIHELGINIKAEVLPFSNIPAYLPPFLLAPYRALRKV
ncbi:MAG: M24 family metallopeptidase [Chloroflexota bacterium]